jgi:hypothetical protein
MTDSYDSACAVGRSVREFYTESQSGAGRERKITAEGLDAFTHAAEAVAFVNDGMRAIVGDEKGVAASGSGGEADAAVGSTGVTDDVSDGFANG